MSPISVGAPVTLNLTTLRKLVSISSAPQESWIEALEEVSKTFPDRITKEFAPPLIANPKIQQLGSYMLDMKDGSGNLMCYPGMWVELPEKGIEKEVLYWGLIKEEHTMPFWAICEVTFDSIRRPKAMSVEFIMLYKLIERTGITPKDIIDNLISFWLTVQARVQETLDEVKSKISCLEFPWLLAQLE